MAVIDKKKRDRLKQELQARYEALTTLMKDRELKSAREGCGRGQYWKNPDDLTSIDSTDLNLALGDFKTILAEIGKIK